MNVTLYRQPDCELSSSIVSLIRAHGHEPVIIDIPETPPTRAQLLALLVGLKMTPREIMQTESELYERMNLKDPALDDHTLLGILLDHPVLIRSPIVVSESGIRLCKHERQAKDIL